MPQFEKVEYPFGPVHLRASRTVLLEVTFTGEYDDLPDPDNVQEDLEALKVLMETGQPFRVTITTHAS